MLALEIRLSRLASFLSKMRVVHGSRAQKLDRGRESESLLDKSTVKGMGWVLIFERGAIPKLASVIF